ncbi:vWA domain-containing protein [Aeoliella mucimassa]|uniref:vWA domain-containing protein n=1 Tax=Aeoliella mucimassa TaxID=2527972 RepID=UPI0021BC9DE6|nr:vWA domain-containing protein [Aeoliella mucimassa]
MLVAFLLPVIVVLSAIAIDIAWMQLVNTELRTATDAAARAGAKVLSTSQDMDTARAAAIEAASRNQVAGTAMQVAPGDVEFGLSEQFNGSRFQFTPTKKGVINAVRVDGLRTQGSAGGPVNLFFARVLGVNQFEPRQQATSTVLDRDICLVIDRSGSMGLPAGSTRNANGQNCGPLDPGTRFGALNDAINVFLDELELTFPEEHVALASYSSNFKLNCGGGLKLDYKVADVRQELTDDYSAIRAVMDDFMTNGIGGSTAIGLGLNEGINEICSKRSRPYAVKTIVLMTDGLHNLGVDPTNTAKQAVARDVVVHTISFSPGADQSRMKKVAEITGGKHFHADSAGDLSAVFQEIARTLPVLLTD